ncbi:MAG: hypothetical protein JRC93_03125 [Deltaproteobacteria bacterium]|nr:hypothetical protein [Deltaproteobacteria bacterium]
MNDEVTEFAKSIGAVDLKQVFDYSEYHGLFKRRNYFLIDKDKFLIIKISRNKIRPFFGLRRKFVDLFNAFTKTSGNYYFVALASNKSGWVLSKSQILKQISSGSLSYSEKEEEYKVNNYNLKDQDGFTSPEAFLKKLGVATLRPRI